MRYYLVPTIGTGVALDPWRPLGSDLQPYTSVKLLRTGQQRGDMWWWVAVEDPILLPQARLIGQDPREPVSVTIRRGVENDLALSRDILTAGFVDNLIFEMLSDPPPATWPALRKTRLGPRGPYQFEVRLGGGVLKSVPAIGGGASDSDNFNRTNETPLGGSWTVGEGDYANVNLTSNVAVPTATFSYHAARWEGQSYGDDQWSEATVVGEGSGTHYIGPAVRMASGTDESCYAGCAYFAGGSGGSRMVETDASMGHTNLATDGTQPTDGSVLRTEASGSTLTLDDDTVEVLNVTDTTITGGQPALFSYHSGGSPSWDDWSADDGVSAAAPGPYRYRWRERLARM